VEFVPLHEAKDSYWAVKQEGEGAVESSRIWWMGRSWVSSKTVFSFEQKDHNFMGDKFL